MSFKEEIKVKKDYFMKDYTKEEVLRTFEFMLKRIGRVEEIEGDLEEIKITQIEGTIVLVAVKTNDNKQEIRVYRLNLDFDKMKNVGYTNYAKQHQ